MAQDTEKPEKTTEPVEEIEAYLEPGQPRPKGLKRYIPVLVVVLGFTVFFVGGFHNLLSFETLADNRADLLAWSADNRVLAALVFMLAYVVVISLSLPGGVWLTLAGGFIFGGVEAAAYVLIGATAGATLIFLGARRPRPRTEWKRSRADRPTPFWSGPTVPRWSSWPPALRA